MTLDLDEVLFVERLHFSGEFSSAALASLFELVLIAPELHAILGERLLEDDLSLGQDAGFLARFSASLDSWLS